jgi:uncharacterized protein YndB with AHSA1/START domain
VVKVEHEVTIARPPADVFAYLTNMEKIPEWQATAVEGRLESERLEEGARAVEVRKFLGRPMESTLRVTAFEPDRHFAAEVVSGPVSFRVDHRLEPDDGGTRVSFTIEGEPGGFFRFAEPVIERQVRRQVTDDFTTLKLRLETGAAGQG